MDPTTASAGDPPPGAEAAPEPVHWSETYWAHALYVLLTGTIAVIINPNPLAGVGATAVAVIGLIGIWRYSWALLHFVRAQIYQRLAFPRMRRRAEATTAAMPPPHAYLLITSFRIPTETTVQVFAATFEAAKQSAGGATVVASIVEMADERLAKKLYHRIIGEENDKVRLVLVRIPGTGKRDGLAYGLRAIQKYMPNPDDIVAVIDGDSIVPPDLVEKIAPFLRFRDDVGALTTDETSRVEGAKIFDVWYSLRFAQRHILMSSMGLSERVLTLTGRMSAFRASLAVDPSFIEMIEVDYLDHWRLGRFRFLTGDDKSTWFWMLKSGYKMLYLPDVVVATIETPPSGNFFKAAAMLMIRWFGNMLRNNHRALALGPNRIGYFTWWTVLDQRVTMWTGLTGPTFAIVGAIFVSSQMLLLYLVWVLMSRYALTILLLSARPRISVLYPFLMFFNQIYGSAVKTFVWFRLDKQGWTRQRTTLARARAAGRLPEWTSSYMHVLTFSFFVVAVAVLLGLLKWPEAWS
jgi:glycosyltransferase Alg8